MMVSALLEAGTGDDHPLRTLERIFSEASESDGAGGVRHAIGSEIAGILEDQVHVANAAIDAWEATGESRWLDRARRLADHVWTSYADGDGALFDVPRQRGGEGFLKQGIKPVQDSPTPSPNGMGGIVAARLFEQRRNRSGVSGWSASSSPSREGRYSFPSTVPPCSAPSTGIRIRRRTS